MFTFLWGWITLSKGTYVFSFGRCYQTVFQSGFIDLHSHQQRMSIPVIPNSRWPSTLSVFFILAFFYRPVVVSNGRFNLPVPDDWWGSVPFHMFICFICSYVYCLLHEVPVQLSHTMFYWVVYFFLLICKNSLYVLDIYLLSGIYSLHRNIYSSTISQKLETTLLSRSGSMDK